MTGATGTNTTAAVSGSTFTHVAPGQSVAAGQTAQYLFFFALNDTGLDALADLTRLNTPGPQELTGLSAEQVVGFANFILDDGNRLQTIQGSDDVDDILNGNAWGDEIIGGTGDDSIAAFGSDDAVRGGGGDDVIDGGDGDDELSGGAGSDVIAGGLGRDLVSGGTEDDLVDGQGGDDNVDGGDGNDLLIGGSGSDQLAGGEDNDILRGSTGDDTLDGGNGDDTLNGEAGADTMAGGAGNDVFIVKNFGDKVVELNTDAGFDEVRSSVSFTAAGQSIEAVTLTGTGDINATANVSVATRLTGNGGTNTLAGGSAADTLDGGGGSDILVGSSGGDVYVIDSDTDLILEFSGDSGIDEIRSSVTYNMGVANIELITLTGTDNIDATANVSTATRLNGNSGTNTLTGGTAGDTLNGGDGADVLIGGEGGDIYLIDSITDTITELAGASGIDEIRASVSYNMALPISN